MKRNKANSKSVIKKYLFPNLIGKSKYSEIATSIPPRSKMVL